MLLLPLDSAPFTGEGSIFRPGVGTGVGIGVAVDEVELVVEVGTVKM
jgi:hypothetical protein